MPPTPWLLSYFDHLRSEFLIHPVDEKKIQIIADKATDQVTEGEIVQLAHANLAKLSLDELLAEAPLLRLKFQDTVGAHQYGVYRPVDISKIQDRDDAKAALLADLSTIVSTLHLHYTLQRHIEGLQQTITASVLKMIVVYSALWGLSVWLAHCYFHAPLVQVILTVIYTGIVGGFISTLRRMQSIPADLDPFLIAERLNGFSETSLWVSPLLGGVFAVVLMAIIMSGLVSGTLFPAFAPASNVSPMTWPFLRLVSPDKTLDFAKLFVWAFVAGFAEQFVPDTLDRLIQRGNQPNAAAGPQTSSGAQGPATGPGTSTNVLKAESLPTSRSPLDKQKGVALDAVLQWPAKAGATYDVSFGSSDPPPLLKQGLKDLTYRPQLQTNTTYFWCITSRPTEGQIETTPVWSFSTVT